MAKNQVSIKTLRKEFDDLREKVKIYEERYQKSIRDAPIQHAMLAFGVGVLCGAVIAHLTRRK